MNLWSEDPQLAARCAALHMDWVPTDVVLLRVVITVAGQAVYGNTLKKDYAYPLHFKLLTSLPLSAPKGAGGPPLCTIDTAIYGWDDTEGAGSKLQGATAFPAHQHRWAGHCMLVAKVVVLWLAAHLHLLVCLAAITIFSCSPGTLRNGLSSA